MENKHEIEILSSLKFLQRIKPGDKIDTVSFKIQERSIYTSFNRMYYGEHRGKTIEFIRDTLDRSILLLKQKAASKINLNSGEDLYHNITKAINGIENFKRTYSEDIMFCSVVDSLISKTKHCLTEIAENYGVFD